MVQAIFLDVDGTLVSFQTHAIPQDALDALYAARSAGVRIFISTGRPPIELPEKLLRGFPFDGYVTMNGQLCYADEQILHERSIPRDDIRKLVSLLGETAFPCLFVERDACYINRINPLVERACSAVDLALPEICDARRALEQDVFQLNLFTDSTTEAAVLAQLPNCSSTRWSPHFADVVPLGGSKRVGVEKMLAHFGISPAQAMAFGDGENDVEMLRFAGIGVAMGNASDHVKACADYVTDCVEEGGIAHALRHFGII